MAEIELVDSSLSDPVAHHLANGAAEYGPGALALSPRPAARLSHLGALGDGNPISATSLCAELHRPPHPRLGRRPEISPIGTQRPALGCAHRRRLRGLHCARHAYHPRCEQQFAFWLRATCLSALPG